MEQNPEENGLLRKTCSRWKNNIKINLEGIG
jgi:hypothetical protein